MSWHLNTYPNFDLVNLFRVLLGLENGVSRTQYRECASIKFGHGFVQDIKFVDDETLMVALVEECKYNLCRFKLVVSFWV